MRTPRVSDDFFARAWQWSESAVEVARMLGEDRFYCSRRAYEMRLRGWKLKKHPRGVRKGAKCLSSAS